MSQISREIIVSGKYSDEDHRKNIANMIVSTTRRYHDPLGLNRKLSGWADGIKFSENSPTLLYTGNMYQTCLVHGNLSIYPPEIHVLREIQVVCHPEVETTHVVRVGVLKEIVCVRINSDDLFYPASGYTMSKGARGRVDLGKSLLLDLVRDGKSTMDVSDSFYSCLDCYACVQVCPAGVNAGKVSQISREIIVSGKYSDKDHRKNIANMIVSTTRRYHDPLGLNRKLSGWADGIKFSENSSTLLYTGNR